MAWFGLVPNELWTLPSRIPVPWDASPRFVGAQGPDNVERSQSGVSNAFCCWKDFGDHLPQRAICSSLWYYLHATNEPHSGISEWEAAQQYRTAAWKVLLRALKHPHDLYRFRGQHCLFDLGDRNKWQTGQANIAQTCWSPFEPPLSLLKENEMIFAHLLTCNGCRSVDVRVQGAENSKSYLIIRLVSRCDQSFATVVYYYCVRPRGLQAGFWVLDCSPRNACSCSKSCLNDPCRITCNAVLLDICCLGLRNPRCHRKKQLGKR